VLTLDETPGAKPAVPGDRQVALHFARLTRDFWRGETARCAWFWTLLLAAGIILTVFANVTVNRWNGWFFDALERKDGHSALVAMAVFPVIVLVVAGLGVVILKSRETFQVHWRRWLTAKLVDGWVGERRFFRLGLSGNEPANPEYRIADDVRWATEPVVDFAMGLLSSVITIVIFIEILWEIGGSLNLPWGESAIIIPAYLVLAAILYAVIVTLLVTAVGRRLAGLIAQRTESEAGLRFALMRIRDHGEAIALARTEPGERQAVAQSHGVLVLRWLSVIRQRARLTWITNGSSALVPVVPLLLAAPKYLAGEMTLGGVVQVAAAFVAVQNACNWLFDNFMRIAEWLAAARRVNELAEALDAVEQEPPTQSLVMRDSPHETLSLEAVTLRDGAGLPLAADIGFELPPGATLHVLGDAGFAKNALLQAIAGLWQQGEGTIALPRGARVASVPQHLQMPRISLRHLLQGDRPRPAPEIAAALRRYGLSTLTSRLDGEDDWDKVLTRGERQRLALARAELACPKVVLLDEATSALEIDAALELLIELRAALPTAIIIAFGQSPGLAEIASHRIVLRRIGGAAAIVERDGFAKPRATEPLAAR
jgi:putative ATP-binding cassette transporter